VVAGDGGCEAYTAIVWGVLLSRESHKTAEAEPVSNVEGNMCGPAMRGTDALPWSRTHHAPKGRRRNLGGSHVRPMDTSSPKARIGKVEEP